MEKNGNLFDDVFSVEILVGVELLLRNGWQDGLHGPLTDLRKRWIGRLRHERIGDGRDALQRRCHAANSATSSAGRRHRLIRWRTGRRTENIVQWVWHVRHIFALDTDADASDTRFTAGLWFAVIITGGFDRFGFFWAFIVTASTAAFRQRQILREAVGRRLTVTRRHRRR